MARRLVERGVRFVQVMMSGQPWDTHSEQRRTSCAASAAAPTGRSPALLTDLKQRGLLDETLVIWTGEFGRTPFAEGKDGRDHHKRGFSLWVAGGGIRGGVTHGATDEFGYAAVQDVVTVADFHATLLHLLGLDFHRLTFHHDTRDERLTDVHQAQVRAGHPDRSPGPSSSSLSDRTGTRLPVAHAPAVGAEDGGVSFDALMWRLRKRVRGGEPSSPPLPPSICAQSVVLVSRNSSSSSSSSSASRSLPLRWWAQCVGQPTTVGEFSAAP